VRHGPAVKHGPRESDRAEGWGPRPIRWSWCCGALDPAVLYVAVSQWGILVCACVVDGEDPAGLCAETATGGAVPSRSASPGASSLSRQALCMGHLFYVQGIKSAPCGLGRDRSAWLNGFRPKQQSAPRHISMSRYVPGFSRTLTVSVLWVTLLHIALAVAPRAI